MKTVSRASLRVTLLKTPVKKKKKKKKKKKLWIDIKRNTPPFVLS
jgi:hypothetical protein